MARDRDRLRRAPGQLARRAAASAVKSALPSELKNFLTLRGWKRLLRSTVETGGANLIALKVAVITGVVVFVLLLLLVVILATIGVAGAQGQDEADEQTDLQCAPSAQGQEAIPGEFIRIYEQAAARFELGERAVWVLASIHHEETGFGTENAISSAGAIGPMQFMPQTWARHASPQARRVVVAPTVDDAEGYATDGDGDGMADASNLADAIHGAARMLRANGAPADWRQAIFAYNHAGWYVDDVLAGADSYAGTCTGAGPSQRIEVPGGPVELAIVRGITVHTSIADHVAALLAAAQRDGLTLTGSGYRSTQRQIELRRAHCGTSHYAIYEAPSSSCSPPTARPGSSMHERGLAIDFNNCSSRATACFQWLSRNAARFGLYNLPSEPWHWSINGN